MASITGCKDVIVTINNWTATDTWLVTVRLVGSAVSFNDVPGYTKTATSNTVIFSGLPEGAYEVAIRRTCANGAVSDSPWKPAAALTCNKPEGLALSNVTANSLTFGWTLVAGASYEWKKDNGPWTAVTAGQASVDVTGLIACVAVRLTVRRKCGGVYSEESYINAIPTAAVPSAFELAIEKTCPFGDTGMSRIKVRLTFCGGKAAVGKYYKLVYVTLYDNVNKVIFNRFVNDSDTLQTIVDSFYYQMSGVEKYIAPDNSFAYVDFYSDEWYNLNERGLPCAQRTTGTRYDFNVV